MVDPKRAAEDMLRERDEQTRASRAERLGEIMLLGEPEHGRMLFGGVDCANALWEAQSSYVNGLDLCAILVSQVCVEKLLSALIELSSGKVADRSYAHLLKDAVAQSFLSASEYSLFDRLRTTRNPYVHHRDINHDEHTMRRAMATGDHPDTLLRRDAHAAINAILNLVNRPPFAIGPVN
jgi:hypothetical protein